MVEVICDTSFLIQLATTRIKNLSNIETEIGRVQFVVPDTVLSELGKLADSEDKKTDVYTTLDFVKSYKRVNLGGSFADKMILDYIEKHGGVVATMDKGLKDAIKLAGGSVISISNNKIVLESSKV